MLWAQEDARPLIEFTLDPLFEDHGLALAVMGVLVVFVALLLVIAFITVLPRALAGFTSSEPIQPPAELAVDDQLSEETVVVIAAAVAESMARPHRIVRIRGLTPEDLGWSLEGRMQLHQSHRISRRDRR